MTLNSIAFTPEDVEKGEFQKFLIALTNMDLEDRYNEIHIWSDGYCQIIDWVTRHYDNSCGEGSFEFIDEDHEVISIQWESSEDGETD